jgi:N-acetylglucosaminyldiphosphoundecaprenol N-acetyl-beta-D-mannosaminyltransferase
MGRASRVTEGASGGDRRCSRVETAPGSAIATAARAETPGRARVRIGQLEIDPVTLDDALERIAQLVDRRRGGAVFTPNVDHVVKAEHHADFRRAYSRADLCLADGMPLVWASRLLGSPLPEKVSGSDLMLPLMRLAAERRWRVYLLGGRPGVAQEAREKLTRELDVTIVGTDSPVIGPDGTDKSSEQTLERLTAASPDLVLVAFGAPKQELWIDRYAQRLGPAVAMGVGGSLDFITGRVRRAPAWISRAGLEWLFRLLQEPRRMWRRYLVEDPAFISIVARSRRRRRRKPSP